MEPNRFDAFTRGMSAGRTRRGMLTALGGAILGLAGMSRLARVEAAAGGNSACADFCHANFSGRLAGQCISDAARGRGVCVQCGPAAPVGATQRLCDGACVDTQTDAGHCGACGVSCPAGQPCVNGSCGCSDQLVYCPNTHACTYDSCPL